MEQLLFSMFLSILTFYFDLIYRSFLASWAPNGLFWKLESGSKIVLESTHTVQQLLFSMFLSILTFDIAISFGPRQFSNTVFRSNHIAETLLFSVLPSIITFVC